LEVLRDDLYDGPGILASYSHHSTVSGKLPRLDQTPETQLPALEEFVLREQRHWGPSTYLWDAEHCQFLLNSSTWTNLRVLDFGSTDLPVELFRTFTSHLPGLKKLRFGFQRETSVEDVKVVKKFIENLEGLECLDIGQPKRGIDVFWPAILRKKRNLKEFVMRPSHAPYYDPLYLNISLLQHVAQDFPTLERVGWDVPLLGGNVCILLRSILLL
jgi:hypothetical protein